MEEVTNLLGDLGGVELNALLAIELERKVDERRRIDRQTVAQDVDDTDSGTTQRVGIGGAIGGSPMAKIPAMVSSLSAQATMQPAVPSGSSSPAKRGR